MLRPGGGDMKWAPCRAGVTGSLDHLSEDVAERALLTSVAGALAPVR